MQVDTLAALGGYLSNFAPSIPGNSYPQTITGLYRTPNLHLRVRGVYTNTVPVDAYRGSGRPEATWNNERLLERGARELGIDVVEMRRRNLIARADFPYSAPGGRVYDSGDPPALLDKLLSSRITPALRREQAELRKRGRPDGHRPCRLHRQGRHRARAAISPSAAACMAAGKARSCACTATARSRSLPAAIRTGRATKSPSARSRPTGSGLPIDDIRSGRRRHRSDPVRQRHLGRALGVRRRGRRSIAPRDKVIAKATRFAAQMHGMRAGRHRISARRVPGARHRPGGSLRRGRRRRLSRRGAAGGRLARSGPRDHRVLRSARHQRSAGHASRGRHRRSGHRHRDSFAICMRPTIAALSSIR